LETYIFDQTTARSIDQFGSAHAGVTHLVSSPGPCFVVCIRLEAGGSVGRHPATHNQLFLVVEGAGSASGETGDFAPIAAGQSAFWRAGEDHETRTETGLTAIVIEGQDIAPGPGMRRIDPQ
jgi:redox-sensitive bicupin YhaK (pirin superfamily)